MEVHHHPIAIGSHSQRKKWTHYFWEFLMLFLAVFCGFLAENQREHMVEHRREKEYMISLLEDLQTDTSNLNRVIPFGHTTAERLNKLISFINNNPLPDSMTKLYQLNSSGASRVVNIGFEDRTSAQLKNAGNMRLIRKKRVADSIRVYWSEIKRAESISDRLEDLRLKASEAGSQLFHNKYYHYSNPERPLSSEISILSGAKLIDDDPKLLAEYSNRRFQTMIVLRNYINALTEIREEAIHLTELIKKEYHLK